MDKHEHRRAREESFERFGHPYGMPACAPTVYTLTPTLQRTTHKANLIEIRPERDKKPGPK